MTAILISLKAVRIHHWLKNCLLFLPLLAAGTLQALPAGLIAFFSLSFAASCVYIVNDLIDIEADRLHPTKKLRPIASGALSKGHALLLATSALLLMMLTLLSLPLLFTYCLLAYLALNTLYNLILKKRVVIDVIALVGMYLLRIIAGSAAMSIPLTSWFLIFIFFFLINLACLKRYGELHFLVSKKRGYIREDQLPLLCFGIGCGLLSVLVFALYLSQTHPNQQLMLLVLPLILYWNMRVWFKAHRGQMNDDPVVFALKDRVSYITFALFLLIHLTQNCVVQGALYST